MGGAVTTLPWEGMDPMSVEDTQYWHVHADHDARPMTPPKVVGSGGVMCSCGVRLFAGDGPAYAHEHTDGSAPLRQTGSTSMQGGVELENWSCSACDETFAIGEPLSPT